MPGDIVAELVAVTGVGLGAGGTNGKGTSDPGLPSSPATPGILDITTGCPRFVVKNWPWGSTTTGASWPPTGDGGGGDGDAGALGGYAGGYAGACGGGGYGVTNGTNAPGTFLVISVVSGTGIGGG